MTTNLSFKKLIDHYNIKILNETRSTIKLFIPNCHASCPSIIASYCEDLLDIELAETLAFIEDEKFPTSYLLSFTKSVSSL